MKSINVMKAIKSLASILSVLILSVACSSNNDCRQCGFQANEQVQNLGTGGAQFYYADGNGCVTISGADCGRVRLQPLSGHIKI